MDICNRFEVNGQNSLYVTGIGPEYTDEEITAVFKVNGDISKLVRIPDESGQPEGRALIQYASDRSISRIDPITLGTVPSPKDPAVMWFARTIRDVCQEVVGREIACRYLDELKSVAGSGRKGFLNVLQEELHGNQGTSHDVHSNATQPYAAQNANTPNNDQNEPAEPTHVYSASASLPTSPVHISEDVFNPPQIQRVIVEHVIRSESTTSPSPQIRLRTFSGRMPRPNGEVDYETWHTQVDLLLNDPSLNDAHKVRRILESLLSPAADVVKPLGISSPPSVYITQLDSAFGVVEDGEELFAAFLGSNQNSGEKPSAYLNRLHSLLTRAISRGGASAGNSNDHLLRQFCRGCWDQSIIIGLQLECKKGNPPTFPEFLLMLRTEEDRRSTKLDRMKKHLGASKANMYAHHVFDMPSYDCEPVPLPNSKPNETSKLEKKVNELTKQLEKLNKKPPSLTHDSNPPLVVKAKRDETSDIENKIAELTKQVEKLAQNQRESTGKADCFAISSSNMKRGLKVPGMPRPWFCFKCGEDNHIAAHCSNEPNPALVRKKNAELRERQDKFLAQQAASPFTLN